VLGGEIIIKTRAEQKLEWLESLKRPLTDAESAELRRCLHATYMKNWRLAQALDEANAAALSEFERAEADTLRKVGREANSPELITEG
jgi:hypothetical protein